MRRGESTLQAPSQSKSSPTLVTRRATRYNAGVACDCYGHIIDFVTAYISINNRVQEEEKTRYASGKDIATLLHGAV